MCGKSLIIQKMVVIVVAKTEQNKTVPLPAPPMLIWSWNINGKIRVDIVIAWTKLKCFSHHFSFLRVPTF